MSSEDRQEGNVPVVRIDDDEMIDLASLLNEEPTAPASSGSSAPATAGNVHSIDVGEGDDDFEALLQRTLGGTGDADGDGRGNSGTLPFGVGAARPPLPKKGLPSSLEDLLADAEGAAPAPPKAARPALSDPAAPGALSRAPGGQWQVPRGPAARGPALPGRPGQAPDPRARRRDRDEPSEEAKRVEELRKKVKEMSADTERFKGRLRAEAAGARDKGREDVLVRMVPILDTLRLALDSASQGTDLTSVIDGLSMLVKQFGNELKGLGLEELESDGATFDPKEHEAFQHVKTGKTAPGTVAQTIRRGYRFKDKLMRPAQVIVEAS